jgi:hypothetical protein
MAKKIIPIKYTSRDFETIKQDLIEHAKRYYPETYKDFNQASFGSLMLDTVAYVGDIMSFYLDYQANESFLDTASEFENIIKLGRQMGYKFSNTNSSVGIATFYISVPANAEGLGPNYDYAPILKKGSSLSTTTGVRFILNEDVRFDNPLNDKRPSIIDPDTGRPIYYAIRARGSVISGVVASQEITVGAYEKYRKVELAEQDIIEIISVFDSEGNEYYEVDYLSQNIIYKSVTNRNIDTSKLAKEIIKPVLVPRRFTVNKNLRSTTLQFGASSDVVVNDNNSMFAEPTDVALNLFGKNYISSDSFDPNRLLNSDKMGISPSNTTLTVAYRYNNTANPVNFSINSLNRVLNANLEFDNEQILDSSIVLAVRNSLEVINEAPIVGNTQVINSDELKRRIESSFSSQGRAVTAQDYKSLVYSMPPQYGSVKRVAVYRDDSSLKRNINLYVLCENEESYLTPANQIVKNNIKTWLSSNKMINDTIDILDGKVVNYSINFTALGINGISKYDILSEAINQLKKDLALLPDFGETFIISNIYNSLKKVSGVLDVTSVMVEPKIGGIYSETQFNFKANTSSDGRFIKVPLNVVMELKYPDSDIKGTIL